MLALYQPIIEKDYMMMMMMYLIGLLANFSVRTVIRIIITPILITVLCTRIINESFNCYYQDLRFNFKKFNYHLCLSRVRYNQKIMKSGKVVIIGSINVMGIVAITGLWYRPLPLPDSQENKSMPIQRKGYVSKYVLTDNAIQTPPKIYDLCRRVVVAFQVSISRVFMFHLGSLRIVVDDNYKSFVHALVAKDCETSVITVSNHRCLLDDAGLFSCLLPYWMNAQPRFLRNTLCAQEFCFNEQVHI